MEGNMEIPIIDISSFVENVNMDEKIKTAEKIAQTLKTVGFFYLINHGIPLQDLQFFLHETARLFKLSEEEKKRLVKKELDGNGFMGIGVENLQCDGKTGIIDYKEALDIRPHNSHPLYSEDQWPSEEELPLWKQNIVEISKKFESVGEPLIRAFSLAMGEEELYMNQYYQEQRTSTLRLLRYPASSHLEDKSKFVGAGEHSDYGVLTILLQDKVGGLQISYNGKWIDATPLEGSFLINVGDCVEFLTNGEFKATRHRVSNSIPQERHVLLLFCEPCMTMPLDTLKKISRYTGKTPQ